MAGWELPVASPCRSSGPSPVGASRCWVLWRHLAQEAFRETWPELCWLNWSQH